MNKTLLLGALLLLYGLAAQAQKAIVLTKSNVPVLPGIVHCYWADVKTLSVPKNGKKIAWDYSGLKRDTFFSQEFVSKIHTPFTNSKYPIVDTTEQEFLVSSSNFHKDEFYDEDNAGFYFIGDYVGSKLIDLTNYFNDTLDNIIVLDQNDSVRQNILSFPDSMGAAHRYKSTKTVRFLWTVTSAGYNKAPSVKRTYYNITDTVAGWGTLRIPAPVKKSITYPVLLIKRKTIAIDSYLVNNQVPNKYFLLAFGITQGKKTVDCNEYFYTTGRQNPLLVIGFGNDSTFTNPANVRFSTDSITPEPPSSINNEVPTMHDFALYPNPTNTGNLTCSFTKPPGVGTWKLLIFNSLGKVALSQNIDGDSKISMALDMSEKSPGLYFVSLFDEDGRPVATGRLDLLRQEK